MTVRSECPIYAIIQSAFRSRYYWLHFVVFFSNLQLRVLFQYRHLFHIGAQLIKILYFPFDRNDIFQIATILLKWNFQSQMPDDLKRVLLLYQSARILRTYSFFHTMFC